MKFELRKVKIVKAMSEETTCFTAEVWADGARLGTVQNRGHGGPNDFRPVGAAQLATFNAGWESLPPPYADLKIGGVPMPMSADVFIGRLLDAHEEAAYVAKKCKKATVFQLIGDAAGDYRTVKAPFSPAVRDFLTKKYGDQIARIYNEPETATAVAAAS